MKKNPTFHSTQALNTIKNGCVSAIFPLYLFKQKASFEEPFSCFQQLIFGFPLLLCLWLWSASILVAQQSLDLLTVSGQFGLPQAFEAPSPYAGKATEKGVMINVVLPVVLNEKQIWYNSINYSQWRVSNSIDAPDHIANPLEVHGLIVRTGLVQQLPNGNKLQLIFMPRLMTDFKHINHRHFQFGGTVMYEKNPSDKLKVGYGVLYNQEAFGPQMVPLVNLTWAITDKWTLSGLLPINSKFRYTINEKWNVGFHHFGLVTSYRLGNKAYQNDYIERRSIDVGGFARYNLGGGIHMEGRCGYSLGRSYAQYKQNDKVNFALPLAAFGDDRIQRNENLNFDNGPYIQLRLIYAISL